MVDRERVRESARERERETKTQLVDIKCDG